MPLLTILRCLALHPARSSLPSTMAVVSHRQPSLRFKQPS